MDLNTALMESITSMSEYFVAANTRTSFTDLAEANIGNGAGNMSGSSQSSLNLEQHFQTTTPTNQTSLQNSATGNSGNNININSSINNINKTTGATTSINQQQIMQNHHHQQQLRNSIASNNNNIHHQNQQQHSQNSPSSLHSSASILNHHGQPNSMQSTTRFSQPQRTQIPIHCYIEQMDTYADMPGGSQSPGLTDSDLFNTVNNFDALDTADEISPTTSLTTAINKSHNNFGHPPHLHQSKLALESVTNGLGGSLGLLAANSSGLFNDDDPSDNNNEDNHHLDAVDTNLEHLDSDSPLSIFKQETITPSSSSTPNNNIQMNSICGNTDHSRPTLSSSFDSPTFQSCRETYAIVTSNVLYIDLLRTVLLQLGYSAMDLINAKATIQIKNWRALALDQVTDDKTATVGEVLGDISTFVTLRIRIYSSVTQLPAEWTETMIRQVVLALTQTMSQLTLSKICNISQPLISSIVRGGKKLGRRKCAEFGQWYMNYIKSPEARPATTFCESGGARLVFDKSREIPQLKAWFATNTKPTDEILEEYSRILNEQSLRKCKPPVTAKALKNWWKNERQKLGIRQREIRGRPKLKRIDFDA